MSKKLPETIIGALPSPERVSMVHRPIHSHFTPDGKIIRCACGWESHLCSTEEDFHVEWMEHL